MIFIASKSSHEFFLIDLRWTVLEYHSQSYWATAAGLLFTSEYLRAETVNFIKVFDSILLTPLVNIYPRYNYMLLFLR